MATLKQLEREIEIIKERNRRVESDKLWETSYTRRFLLMLFTYFWLLQKTHTFTW